MKNLKSRIEKLENKIPPPRENGFPDEDITHFEAYLRAIHNGYVVTNWDATAYLRSLSKFLYENRGNDKKRPAINNKTNALL